MMAGVKNLTKMATETSIRAYNSIQPQLPKARLQVLEKLKVLGEATNAELASELKWGVNRVTPRIFELRQQGLVMFALMRPCKMTGRPAMAWKVNSAVEIKLNRADMNPIVSSGGMEVVK